MGRAVSKRSAAKGDDSSLVREVFGARGKYMMSINVLPGSLRGGRWLFLMDSIRVTRRWAYRFLMGRRGSRPGATSMRSGKSRLSHRNATRTGNPPRMRGKKGAGK